MYEKELGTCINSSQKKKTKRNDLSIPKRYPAIVIGPTSLNQTGTRNLPQ